MLGGSAVDLHQGLAAALAGHGLIVRGSLNILGIADGRGNPRTRTVVLVGTAGAAFWPHFQAWLARQPQRPAEPLDTWSREVLSTLDMTCGARAISPSDKPYWPFQQWAMQAEGLKPSPLGILMHPLYGLWHAYRGALLFDAELPLAEPPARQHLCASCAEKPCLKVCPVAAHDQDGFAYGRCLDHIGSAAGGACRDFGCLDRNACPAGAAFRYPPEVQAFHMAAFARPVPA